jgi:large subunit ribosomal protein L30
MASIKVTQIKSPIGRAPNVKKVLTGLGLRGMHQVKVHKDNNCIRGMINKVKRFVSYEILDK